MILIYVTYPSQEDAERISKALLGDRLVACVNIFPAHRSLYWWDGAIQNESEVAAIYKSLQERFDEIKTRVEALHPYDVPCVVALPIEQSSSAFSKWLMDETSD